MLILGRRERSLSGDPDPRVEPHLDPTFRFLRFPQRAPIPKRLNAKLRKLP